MVRNWGQGSKPKLGRAVHTPGSKWDPLQSGPGVGGSFYHLFYYYMKGRGGEILHSLVDSLLMPIQEPELGQAKTRSPACHSSVSPVHTGSVSSL